MDIDDINVCENMVLSIYLIELHIILYYAMELWNQFRWISLPLLHSFSVNHSLFIGYTVFEPQDEHNLQKRDYR